MPIADDTSDGPTRIDSLAALATETRNPLAANLDRLDAESIARLMNGHDASVAPVVATQMQAIGCLIEAIVERLRRGGRLIFTGAGTSGRLGVLDAAECVPTFQSPPGQVTGVIAGGMGAMFRAVEGAEDSPGLGAADLRALGLDHRDCVVGIAASGRTPYVLGALEEAARVGALTAALACVQNSQIGALASHVIEVETGPEVLMGSTRLRAGTATKLVLNTLTTGTMILLGKTHGDLMVDMSATNDKLRLRAVRLVAMAAAVDSDTAREGLVAAGNEVKTAIVSLISARNVDESRACLKAAGGHVARALVTQPGVAGDQVPRSVVVGIDGGGTALKVRLAIREGVQWRRLENSTGHPALPITHGLDGTAFEWRRRILAELERVGLDAGEVGAVVAGTSGAGTPVLQARLSSLLAAWFPGTRVKVLTDVGLLALAAADPAALCLVAGTGSIAWWEPGAGKCLRAGGFGPGIGDEGGGAWLADEGIRAVCMAEDGRGPETSLRQVLLAATEQTDARGLANWRQGAGRAAAGLARLVLEQASHGDTVAGSLRSKGLLHLRALAQTVLRNGGDHRPKTLVAGGGLFNDAAFWLAFTESFHSRGMDLPEWTRVVDPVDGALGAAERLLTSPNPGSP